MSNEEQLPVKKPKMEPVTQISFERRNDLTKLLKQLDKLTPDSIATLVEVLQDKEADPKLRVDVAKTLLATRIAVSESISKDQLGRSIAQARLVMAAAPKLGPRDVEEEDDKPIIRFEPSVILSMEKVINA